METQDQPLFFGLDCGGTRSVVLAVSNNLVLDWQEFGPANLQLMTDRELEHHFRRVKQFTRRFSGGSGIGVGMAGARTSADRARIQAAANKVWPGMGCHPSNDLETALAAADLPDDAGPLARILVLSGTGSCCFGQAPSGKTVQVGGWGHILGDKGSGYEIGLRGLKATIYYYDRDGKWPALGVRLLRRLSLNRPNDLIPWAARAKKNEIATLAEEVFQAWEAKDVIARDIVAGALHSLAKDAITCACRLTRKNKPVQFVFAGSILLKQSRFAQRLRHALQARWPASTTTRLNREPAWGAMNLARDRFAALKPSEGNHRVHIESTPPPARVMQPVPWIDPGQSPTEMRNPRSLRLDRLSIPQGVRLMLQEEEQMIQALLSQTGKIARAVQMISAALKRGGKLFYFGAGTSGRLGVLDASECPPTFRTPPEMVQGVIAGGQSAMFSAVEGAEDDLDNGAEAVRFRGVSGKDVVVGIAASGRTPFVWGALGEAKKRGAKTILVTFNPGLKIDKGKEPNLILATNVGPEVITGSTRLKAGTATKCILNIFSTLSMVRMGKVVSNLMVDLNPSNIKLRERAVRIVQELSGAEGVRAREALEQSGWKVKEALEKISPRRRRYL